MMEKKYLKGKTLSAAGMTATNSSANLHAVFIRHKMNALNTISGNEGVFQPDDWPD